MLMCVSMCVFLDHDNNAFPEVVVDSMRRQQAVVLPTTVRVAAGLCGLIVYYGHIICLYRVSR